MGNGVSWKIAFEIYWPLKPISIIEVNCLPNFRLKYFRRPWISRKVGLLTPDLELYAFMFAQMFLLRQRLIMCEINLHDQGFITCSNDSSRWGLLDWKTQGGGRGQGTGHKGVISILKQHSYIPWTPKITNFKIPNENSIYFLGHYDFYCHTLVFLILIYMFPTIGLWWIIIKRVWKIAIFWWESIQSNKNTLLEQNPFHVCGQCYGVFSNSLWKHRCGEIRMLNQKGFYPFVLT